MPSVLKNTKNFLTIDNKLINNIKDEYYKSEKISRLLVHNSPEDNVQEMIICFGKSSLIFKLFSWKVRVVKYS